ncbi:membrane protein [Bacteroidia bacterium]|nr:membrane protein [Bacteroidia bacterium]
MSVDREHLKKLTDSLNVLAVRQAGFAKDLEQLRVQLAQLTAEAEAEVESVPVATPVITPAQEPVAAVPPLQPVQPKSKSNFEKFVGENLLNKIGIVIIVLGVAIGAKYAIDHELITPLTRIVLGYLFGAGLLGVAFKLKQKYEGFSAVLLSGSMAILYIITYCAYDFYAFLPQGVAFALMVVFTAFTILAAIQYNRQVIAHIGLVGAYAVPFLLSRGDGNVVTLFSYIAIINAGILAVSFKKYWKSLYYVAFPLTWLIYAMWYVAKYSDNDAAFTIALCFAGIFFATFYAIFLCYKLLNNHKYNEGDILLLLANAFIFFGFGYATFNKTAIGEQLLGLFTLFNALIHFAVSVTLFRQKLVDKQLFYLIVGLVLVFITIAIPVQLEGSWVTLLWAGEAALLCWIGRTKKVPLYEQLSLPLMLLAFFSIIHDWSIFDYDQLTPFFNVQFLSGLIFAGAFAFIAYLNTNQKYPTHPNLQKFWVKTSSVTAVSILLFSLYVTFYIEIYEHFEHLRQVATATVDDENLESWLPDANIRYRRSIWLIIYSLLFFAALTVINRRKFRNKVFDNVMLGLNAAAIFWFLTAGLYKLSLLRESYLNNSDNMAFTLGIRYVAFIFAGGMLAVIYRQIRDSGEFITKTLHVQTMLCLHLAILWIASSELLNWCDIAGFDDYQSYKLGLSILWGIYSLWLIVLGILKRLKYLRIGAISLFGVTLVKLFFYDIAHLDGIAKTIIFLSLGILLLIISFLYNKYKHIIYEEKDPH